MSFFLRNNYDEGLDGNKYYWKITKFFQDGIDGVDMTFKLQSKTWKIRTIVYDGFLYLYTRSFNINYSSSDVFESRAGIVGDDLKEITERKMNIGSTHKLIRHSELESIRLSNKVLYLFVEIRRKDQNDEMIKTRK